MCLFWQHHVFLSGDQPACQFEYPALQSQGSEVPMGTGVELSPGPGTSTCCGTKIVEHPIFFTSQHHCFFGADHPASQLEYPALQSYGSETGVGGGGGGGGG